MKKRNKPGWGHWRALWVELACNTLGCRETDGHRPIHTGGIVLHVPTKFCLRCRRTWDAR